MEAQATEANLAKLPAELLGFIIPSPFDLKDVKSGDVWLRRQAWLPIKLTWPPLYNDDPSRAEKSERQELVQTLRALSQTSRRLRSFALVPLWSVVHVATVEELGRLRETLRVSPYLAAYVRDFCFMWDMGGQYSVSTMHIDWYSAYDDNEGGMLDLAFRNRMHLWESIRDKDACQVKREPRHQVQQRVGDTWYSILSDTVYFELNGKRYNAPGECARAANWTGSKTDLAWDYDAPRQLIEGPDGKGEDRIVKCPDSFKASLAEVVESFSSLRSFGWASRVTPIPSGVFDALVASQTLTSLSVELYSTEREGLHELPLWNVSAKLTMLSLTASEDDIGEDLDHSVEEQLEADLNAIEAPSPSPIRSVQDKESYHLSIICRTIVAAARGGKLRALWHDASIQKPFAIRALLPCWVQVEKWTWSPREWQSAARALRRLLAHLSYSLNQHERPNLQLTRIDVQALRAHVEQNHGAFHATRVRTADFRYVLHYVTWLEEDENLAQQVADAWNAVVERGEAGVVECTCDECPGVFVKGQDEEYYEEEEDVSVVQEESVGSDVE